MLKYINLAREFPTYFIKAIDQQIERFVDEKDLAITPDIIY